MKEYAHMSAKQITDHMNQEKVLVEKKKKKK